MHLKMQKNHLFQRYVASYSYKNETFQQLGLVWSGQSATVRIDRSLDILVSSYRFQTLHDDSCNS